MKKRLYLVCLSFSLLFSVSLCAQYEEQVQLAKQYLQANKEKWDLTDKDIADFVVSNVYESKHNGVTHIYFNQRYNSIDIYNAIYNVNILPNNKVLFSSNRFYNQIASKINTTKASLSPEEAIGVAIDLLKITETPNLNVKKKTGDCILYQDSNISDRDLTIQLVYQPMEDGTLKLAWQLAIDMLHSSDYWDLRLDAQNGELLKKDNYTTYCIFHKSSTHANHECDGLEHKAHSPSSFFSTNNSNTDGSSYTVFPIPIESPIHGNRTTVTEPAILDASPFGWHDIDGREGADFSITRGNNVHAYADLDGRNSSIGNEPRSKSLQFDFAFDANAEPLNHQDAAVTQLFYMSNIMHDLSYQYGFDEGAGNFQENNYDKGGLEGDFMRAEALDSARSIGTITESLNNANYSGGPDGSPGRVQMFVWNQSGGRIVQIIEPAAVATDFEGRNASFGPSVLDNPVRGEVAIAFDNSPQPTLACNAIVNRDEINGKIALIDRGLCDFVDKIRNAQAAGAIAVIVCNFEDAFVTMGAPNGDNASDITIPSVFMQRRDCDLLRQFISEGLEVELGLIEQNDGPDFVSGSFDNGIVAHEYTHGISERLVGGPNRANCLRNAEQMGEGWSDFFSLVTGTPTGSQEGDRRGIGTYALRQDVQAQGIRRFPYSTDLDICPYTYEDILGTGVHETGAVWAAMLWDLYWAMSNEHGWDPDPINGTGGNNMAIQLVMDGMKMTPCGPGFVDARDAILAADEANYGGANQCLIWGVFARRGLGFSADQGDADSRDAFEGYDVLPQCIQELKITKTVTDFINPGDEINVVVTVTNHKGEAVTDLAVSDILPEGLTYKSGSASITPTINNGQIVFNLGELPNDESMEITYTLVSDSDQASISRFFDGGEDGDDIWLYIDQEGTNFWDLTDDFPRTGDFSWHIIDAQEDNRQIMLLDEPITLGGQFPALRFYHWYNTEPGSDGGIVELSTDGGNTWLDAAPYFIRNGYTGETDYRTFAEPNRRTFWGNSEEYISTYIDLRPLAETSEIFLRYRFGSVSLNSTADSEWFIDDIEFLDLLNYNSEVCATSAEGDNVCALAVEGGTIVETGSLNTAVDNLEDKGLLFKVFPNPAGDYLNVSLSNKDADEGTITLFNMNGQAFVQKSVTIDNNTQIVPFNVNDLAAGFYFIEVRTPAGVAMKKVALQ